MASKWKELWLVKEAQTSVGAAEEAQWKEGQAKSEECKFQA